MSTPAITADLVPKDLAPLVEALLPSWGAALYTAGAGLLWSSGCWRDGDLDGAAALVAAQHSRAVPQMLPNGRAVRLAAVSFKGAEDNSAVLAVISDGQNAASADAVAALAALLSMLCGFNRELDGMAAELSDRYEELNLIYSTGESARRGRNARAALDDIVHSCRVHLNASFVCLVMPQQRITLASHDGDHCIANLPEFLHEVGNGFFTELKATGRSVVCNDGLAAAPELERFGPLKLAAMPIRDSRQTVCGALLIVNPVDAVDFSNSDRNLLGAVTEKAATVIATSYDSLTGLLSRIEIEQRLQALFADVQRRDAEHFVLCIYVDALRAFNETMGPAAGDAMLQCVSSQLEKHQTYQRVAARLGGDDFALLLPDSSLTEALAVAEQIRASVRTQQVSFADQPIAMTVSVGVARMGRESESAMAVLRGAELASGIAHEQGRDGVHVYRDGAESVVRRSTEMRWVGRIHDALRNDRFRLYGQTIQPLNAHGDPHIEILLRLLDDDGLHSPGEFLPAAERYYLMPAIDRWVITHSLKLLAECGKCPPPFCAINLSGQSMSDESFIEFILGELDRAALPCERICFEITETSAIKSLDAAKEFILRLKQRGCRFSLDDFGTGLSSFSYLKSLPVDFVKIDGSFVKSIVEDGVSESMVRAITEIGHAMGLRVIAEYVENAAIRAKVRSLGVDFAQGYAVDRPVELGVLIAGQHAPHFEARA